MRHQHHRTDHDGDVQTLAVTIALLLLIGAVLLTNAWFGPYAAFVLCAAPIVLGYAARPVGPLRAALRALAVRRAVRRLLRSLPGA